MKNPYIQVKRPIKINKYHLKIGKKSTQKIPAKELHKSKVQVNEKKGYKAVSNLFRDSLRQNPVSCGN